MNFNFNFLKSKKIDYVNIVYFKNKGKLSSFTISYKLFSFLKTLVIIGLIWLPISIYIITVQLNRSLESTNELTKNRNIILAYQDQINSVYKKTYSDYESKLLDERSDLSEDKSNTDSDSGSDSALDPSSSSLTSNSILPIDSDSSSDLVVSNTTTNTNTSGDNSNLVSGSSISEVDTSSKSQAPVTPGLSSFPVEIQELKYSYSDTKLDLSFNLVSSVHPKAHKGRLQIVAKLSSSSQEDKSNSDSKSSFIVYPNYSLVSAVPNIKSGESFKVASFKSISSQFSSPDSRRIVSFKIICYSNETRSSIEKEIIL